MSGWVDEIKNSTNLVNIFISIFYTVMLHQLNFLFLLKCQSCHHISKCTKRTKVLLYSNRVCVLFIWKRFIHSEFLYVYIHISLCLMGYGGKGSKVTMVDSNCFWSSLMRNLFFYPLPATLDAWGRKRRGKCKEPWHVLLAPRIHSIYYILTDRIHEVYVGWIWHHEKRIRIYVDKA